MALYRWNTKLAWIWKSFNPENSWTEGQFLKKTSTWYAYDNVPEVNVDSELSITSENPVQNKVITNALQNAWWSSDHLEAKAPVWELYQLTDTMFLQNTPTLANSTVEQKVWDTANNTQIHIQRIASWTGSNELKLKLKKVWTPWDLSVQVMKWVQVTVTANVEAYWYWDSNNVLASWTVSASSITTSWQEITVTLDNEVWWTEWELLDIVLSIPSVDASNYVVIACDSTQWSEWFSLVAVNGSTRTRSKLMPYCISDWFAQWLLCKVSNTNYEVAEYFYNVERWTVTYPWERWDNIVLKTPWTLWAINNLKVTAQLFTSNARMVYYISSKYNSSTRFDITSSSWEVSDTSSISQYQWIQIVCINTSSSQQTITYTLKVMDLKADLSKPTSVWKWKLRWNNSLWIMDAITLFWVHSDWTWTEYDNS